MKTIFTTFLLLVGLTISQAQSDTRSLGSFQGLDVSGSISVQVIQSSESKAEITIVKGSLDQLMTEVSGSTLKVNFTSKNSNNWGSGAKANIVIYTKSLNSIDASAGAAVESDDLWESKSMDVQASSGARIAVATTSNQLSTEASSGAKITLRGNTNKLTAECSSGAAVNLLELIAIDVEASASSGGTVKVNAAESISASATAGGSVKFKGDPSKQEIQMDKYSGGIVSEL